jgi:hypothetical protein
VPLDYIDISTTKKITYDEIEDAYDMMDFAQQNVVPLIYKTETLA